MCLSFVVGVLLVYIIFRNIEEFLPTNTSVLKYDIQANSHMPQIYDYPNIQQQ